MVKSSSQYWRRGAFPLRNAAIADRLPAAGSVTDCARFLVAADPGILPVSVEIEYFKYVGVPMLANPLCAPARARRR